MDKKVRTEIKVLRFLLKTGQKNFKKNRKNYFKLIEKISSFLSITRPPNSYWAKSYSHFKKKQNLENGPKCTKIVGLGGVLKNTLNYSN